MKTISILFLLVFNSINAEIFNGFIETRTGMRTQDEPVEKDSSISEVRLQLEKEKDFNSVSFNFVADFIYDNVINSTTVNLSTGEGYVDLRQANLFFSPFSFMDVKIGRQILTWGTGDLLFINDQFSKDWNAFLIGRDDEYLKAPSDALKFSMFFDVFNIDLIYTPRFNADRYIDGKRNSFYDPMTGSFRGINFPLVVEKPDDWFNDDELSLRFYRLVNSLEMAFYYYHGFWKSPAGFINETTDESTGGESSGHAIFPELEVFGSSFRWPIASGIANIEMGYYKNKNQSASNPFVRNDEWRLLLGYEQEIAKEFTASIQYYIEHKNDYQDYVFSLPDGALPDDENRQLITLRLTKLLRQQDVKLMLYNYYSPTDKDGHIRFNGSYKISDALKIDAGWNHFYGNQQHTFFAQLENNSSIYMGIRYNF